MTTLNSRTFGFAVLAAPTVLTTASSPAFAQAQSGTSALFDAPLGNYRITTLFDGMGPLQKGMFIGGTAEIDATLSAAGIVGDSLPAPIQALLLQSDDQTILIDACMGGVELLGPYFGRMFTGLTAVGVTPEDVDLIILTLAHPDHIGGMILAGKPVFPNAEVVLTDVEFGFWLDEGIMSQAPEEARGLFQLAQGVYGAYGDRVRPVASGTEVVPLPWSNHRAIRQGMLWYISMAVTESS